MPSADQKYTDDRQQLALARDKLESDYPSSEWTKQLKAPAAAAASTKLLPQRNSKMRWAFSPRTRLRAPSGSRSTRARHPIGSPMVCG